MCTRALTFLLHRYSKLQEDKEQLEQKHLHMLHILEAETQAKWQNIRQIEDLSDEVKKLKAEVSIKIFTAYGAVSKLFDKAL